MVGYISFALKLNFGASSMNATGHQGVKLFPLLLKTEGKKGQQVFFKKVFISLVKWTEMAFGIFLYYKLNKSPDISYKNNYRSELR